MSSLLKFFGLTYVLSWASFISAAVIASNPAAPALIAFQGPLFLLGTFAPALVALALTARAEGGAGIRALLSELLRWRVGARWYLFAVIYMAVIKLAVALIFRLATHGWPRFGGD